MMAVATALLVQALAPVVHHPPDATVVSGGGVVHVVGEVGGGREAGMEVVVGGRRIAARSDRRADGQSVLHAAVSLAPGLNRLEIGFSAEGRPITTVRRSIFFSVPLVPDVQPPQGFVPRVFHDSSARPACRGCHELTARAADAAPSAPDTSTCFSCHASLTRLANVHGPAAQWACTRCHDAGGGRGSPYATPVPVMTLCFSCHVEQKERQETERYQHGPTATGACTLCHNPHGTEHPLFLKKAPWDLCTTCHAEKGSGRHVIAWGPAGQTHPTRGRPDPSRHNGQELSCASCHNPHAAPAPKLWNFRATMWLDLCRNCHKGIVGE